MQEVLTVQIDKAALGKLVDQQRRILGSDGSDLSYRDLAKLLHVSHSTLLRAIDPKDASIPDTEFFYHLANIAGLKLSTVLSLAFPDAENVPVSAQSEILAQRLGRMNQDTLEIVERFILSTISDTREKIE